MSDAQSRRAQRATWSAKVYRGANVLAEMEADALAEWAAMTPNERLALAWILSVAEGGIPDDDAFSARLPRSSYRVEPR